MRSITLAAPLLSAGLALFAGCDDSTGVGLDPQLVEDTVGVAAPLPQNADLPTALDITGTGFGSVQGGRFPELPAHAEDWDFAVRIRDGEMVLVPARAIGLASNAGITEALTGESFEGLREVPGQSTLLTDTAVVLRLGAVYAARSRETAGGFFGVCVQFAKLSPIELDVAQGRVTFRIVTNEQCGDPRLVQE